MHFSSDYFISIPFVLSFYLIRKKEQEPTPTKVCVPALIHAMADVSATDKDMITVITQECNEISQELYDAAMDSIQNCQLECSCGHCGCLVGHGGYTRYVKTAIGKIPMAIRRVQCSFCDATHALLLSSIVPYSQVPLSDHAAIASSYEQTASAAGKDAMDVMDTNPELTPSQVFYILSLYIRFWRQRLLSESLPLSPVHALTQPCIRLFERQFMQIKNTRNILFVPPT